MSKARRSTITTQEKIGFNLTEEEVTTILEQWGMRIAAGYVSPTLAGEALPAVSARLDVSSQGFLRGADVDVTYTKIEEKGL